MEEMIQEEIVQFKHLLDGVTHEPIDFVNRLNLPILNALWNVTVGERSGGAFCQNSVGKIGILSRN